VSEGCRRRKEDRSSEYNKKSLRKKIKRLAGNGLDVSETIITISTNKGKGSEKSKY
jgi:hypothetical protein